MRRKNFMVLALAVFLVLGIMLSSGCAPSAVETPTAPRPEIPAPVIQDITPQEANALIQANKANPNFVILDVRTPAEFAEGHIENALNIDFYSESFRQELDKLDKNKIYLVYCRSGSRSLNTVKIMEGFRFKNLYNMLDGIIRWRGEGLPTVK